MNLRDRIAKMIIKNNALCLDDPDDREKLRAAIEALVLKEAARAMQYLLPSKNERLEMSRANPKLNYPVTIVRVDLNKFRNPEEFISAISRGDIRVEW